MPRDAAQASAAAEALRLTSTDLLANGIVDSIVAEPLGGAHRAPAETVATVGAAIHAVLTPLMGLTGAALIAARRERFLHLGRTPL